MPSRTEGSRPLPVRKHRGLLVALVASMLLAVVVPGTADAGQQINMIVAKSRPERWALKNSSWNVEACASSADRVGCQRANGNEPAGGGMCRPANEVHLVFGVRLSKFQIDPDTEISAGLDVGDLANQRSSHVRWAPKAAGVGIVSK